MLLQHKKVAIIGAGPVGLTMAKLLQQNGIQVTVYERDKDPQARIWGGTLDLHETSGQVAMKHAGLLEGYFARATPMGRTITDVQGTVLFSVKPQTSTPEINRNQLRQLLLESLASDTVVWDRKVIALEAQNGEWLVRFDNGPTAIADLIIGANGGMSTVRKYVTDSQVEYTGTVIIQGEVFQPEVNCQDFYQLCNSNILMTAGQGMNLVANPNNNGALTYNVTFRAPADWQEANELNFQDTASIISFLLDKFAYWHKCYRQLVRSTSFFVGLPARKLGLEKPWKSNRPLPITLIGDAAHLMPPFAGQGVNTGLMDALILADNLTSGNHQTLEAAIRDYEQKMMEYATTTQKQTAENEIAMHQPDFSFQKRFA